MANEDVTQEIEVTPEIKEEKPEIVVESAEKGGEKAHLSVEEGIEALKRRLQEEKTAREYAEKQAQEAAYHAQMARNEVDNANLHLVQSAIDTVRRETEILKANYKNALAVNDYDAAGEAQEAMNHAAAKLLQLENGMAAMEARPKQPIQPPQHSDPVERMAASLSPQSAAWVRAHPEYARNQRLTQKMIAAHNLITADGIKADTPEYFSSVERILGISSGEDAQQEVMSAASAPAQRRAAPAAAPVSRTAPGTRPNVVRLSSEEREMAQMMNMSPEEYAKNKLALQREGKLH